jgi:hypothetical protein
MQKPVSLTAITEAFDELTETSHAYLDRETGEIHHLSDDYLSAAEEDDEELEERADWEVELIQQARTILQDTQGRYLELPDQFEIDEYRFLSSFADSYPDPSISKRLVDAIRGEGAFRRFKDLVHRLGIADQWYEYRSQRLLEVARDWCEGQTIPYEKVAPL